MPVIPSVTESRPELGEFLALGLGRRQAYSLYRASLRQWAARQEDALYGDLHRFYDARDLAAV